MSGKTIKEDDVKIGRRIRGARIAAGMSQEILGAKLGLSFQQVQKYEKGTNRVGGSRMLQIAKALGVNVADFFGDPVGEPAMDRLTIMATKDGFKLVAAFNRIENPEDRAMVVAMAERLSHPAV